MPYRFTIYAPEQDMVFLCTVEHGYVSVYIELQGFKDESWDCVKLESLKPYDDTDIFGAYCPGDNLTVVLKQEYNENLDEYRYYALGMYRGKPTMEDNEYYVGIMDVWAQ